MEKKLISYKEETQTIQMLLESSVNDDLCKMERIEICKVVEVYTSKNLLNELC